MAVYLDPDLPDSLEILVQKRNQIQICNSPNKLYLHFENFQLKISIYAVIL